MLKEEVVSRLNVQIVRELYTANLYTNMSSWCCSNGFDGSGTFLFNHAEEERGHAKKLMLYLNEVSAKIDIKEVPAPESNYSSLSEVFEKIYNHELSVTVAINGLMDFLLETKDYCTFHALQWYVGERHKEEALFSDIVEKIKLLQASGSSMYFADEYVRRVYNKDSRKRRVTKPFLRK